MEASSLDTLNTTSNTVFSDEFDSLLEEQGVEEPEEELLGLKHVKTPPKQDLDNTIFTDDLLDDEEEPLLEEKKLLPTNSSNDYQSAIDTSTNKEEPKKSLLDLWRKNSNAVQTEIPKIKCVVSYLEKDNESENFAFRIEDLFSSLKCRYEPVDPDSESQNLTTEIDEFRICILSVKYGNILKTARAAADAAENEMLIVFKVTMEDEESMIEEWQSLLFHDEYVYSASSFNDLKQSVNSVEKQIIKRISSEKEEYTAIVQIDDYQVIQELGHGAQGIVYKAEHEKTKAIVAIKEMKNLVGKVSTQTKTEIAIMKRLNHPNIVKLIQVYEPLAETSTSIFLVLEFVPGGSLFKDDEVWKGDFTPLSMQRAQEVFQDVVKGISYLHHMGILHRDIKPSNLLGNREYGIIKVADFGVSSFTKQQKSARVLGEDDILYVGSSGTPAFLPPEASGGGYDIVYHGRPADVWSLGVTLYTILAGNLPFRGKQKNDTARLICTQPLKIPSKFGPQISELLVKMLDKNPEKRATLQVVASHPWVNVNWKDVESITVFNSKISGDELEKSISLPQLLKKSIKQRSRKILNAGANLVNLSIASSDKNSWKSQGGDSEVGNNGSTFETINSLFTWPDWLCCTLDDFSCCVGESSRNEKEVKKKE